MVSWVKTIIFNIISDNLVLMSEIEGVISNIVCLYINFC